MVIAFAYRQRYDVGEECEHSVTAAIPAQPKSGQKDAGMPPHALSVYHRPGSIRSRVTGAGGTGSPARHNAKAAIAFNGPVGRGLC
jgi:hypothetical protein